ncbi:hypothetical protein V6Z11_D05G061600 [Gossypium hirsutum]
MFGGQVCLINFILTVSFSCSHYVSSFLLSHHVMWGIKYLNVSLDICAFKHVVHIIFHLRFC